MAIFETLILPALIPAAVDGVKNLIGKFTAPQGYKPVNVDEQIKLENSNVARLQALAQLDNPYGAPSQWVVDLRASFRYVFSGVVIVAALATLFIPVNDAVRELAFAWGSGAFGFIFGERMYLGFKSGAGVFKK